MGLDLPIKTAVDAAGGGAAGMQPDQSVTSSAAESAIKSSFQAGGININKGISTTTILIAGGIAAVITGVLFFFKSKK